MRRSWIRRRRTDKWEEVYERMRAAPEGMIRQIRNKEIEGGMKSGREAL